MNDEKDSALADEMVQQAAMHVEMYGQHFGIALDYSEVSLDTLDKAISTYHPNGAMSEMTYHPYAAYVGEVVRRNLGGNWTGTEDRGPGISIQAGEKSAMVFPIAWIAKRFEEGPDESIAFKYSAVRSICGNPGASKESRDEAAGACPPSASSSKIPPPDAARQKGRLPEGGSMVEVEKAQEILAKGPAMVFLFVAGADGEIDKREKLKLAELINMRTSHPCKLFRASINMMVADLPGVLKSCDGFSAITAIPELIQLRETAEKLFPDEAKDYCQALFEFAEQVASASGGFLGFGEKISKEEKAALGLLGAAFRIGR